MSWSILVTSSPSRHLLVRAVGRSSLVGVTSWPQHERDGGSQLVAEAKTSIEEDQTTGDIEKISLSVSDPDPHSIHLWDPDLGSKTYTLTNLSGFLPR
jgi:hypothetical protein